MRGNKKIIFKILLLPFLLLTGCASGDEPQVGEEVTPQIVFLFSPGGLGDMSYNDCILQGVQQFKKAHPEVDVFMSSPASAEEAERIFSDWMKRPGSDIPVVFVLASSDFEPYVDKYTELYSLTDNKRILLFESLKQYADPRIYTFQISMYGASYLAGIVAREIVPERESLVVLASSTDIPVMSGRDGFIAGYGSHCDVEYLADDWSGYVMPTEAYRRMPEWTEAYGFIYPIAGGSNAGIYRYAREFPDAPYLAGIDVDQSSLCHKITGSVVKDFPKLIDRYFTQWLAEGTMPESQIYGIESGYVDWVFSPRYEAEFRSVVEAGRREAIAKEKEYYEMGD